LPFAVVSLFPGSFRVPVILRNKNINYHQLDFHQPACIPTSTTMLQQLQNERTLEWWDDYHKENEDKEWILQPSPELLEFLRRHCPCSVTEVRMLEIGCGTSILAREVWKNFQEYSFAVKIHMCATDVSSACIQTNQQRDASFCSEELEYQTLNILQPDYSKFRENSYNIILDKGCLDTFLFRSRNRGNNNYSLMQTLLDNVWKLLTSSNGMYVFISPRAKCKAVRDYAGFASVRRHILPLSSRALLVGDNNTQRPGYVYICTKNRDYSIGTTLSSMPMITLPSDSDKCPNCSITFYDLRKGENMERRGGKFWTRQWKGHCTHCK
jgi:hypothetical protein